MDEETIRRIAHLARLDPADAGDLGPDIARIIDYVDRLREVDVTGIPPYIVRAETITRRDRPEPGLTREEALESAPDRDDRHFRVPPEPRS